VTYAVSAPPLALLVPTKLAPPQPNPLWVARERLLALLDAGPHARLTVVVAPAGFGKSTLVAQWIEGRKSNACGAADTLHPYAWLTLDEHDHDGLRFLAYVAGAVEQAAPDVLQMTRPLLVAPEPPPLYMVAQALLVDLSALPAGLTLVLDDYHEVVAEPVHQIVAYLLRHLPPACRLVIVSRVDPPLPLARLRAEQQLTEVRVADLRFTIGEAEALLAGLLGGTPDPRLVGALHAETEGWAIALQLAALAVNEADATQRPLSVAMRPIGEYLAEEVFDRQPAPVRAALQSLAVPERVCAGLAAALLDPPGDLVRAEDLLDRLVQANLLLVPLDAEGRWYRFHHLFRDMLLRRLALQGGKQAVAALQLRAARWLEAEGLPEEAVRRYLAAGAEEAAGALVERLLAPELGRDVSRLRPGQWLRLLPQPLVARRPGLALLEARIGFTTLNVPAIVAGLARVDELLAAPGAAGAPPPWPTFPADLAVLRGTLSYFRGRSGEAIDALETVLDHEVGLALGGQTLMLLGRAYVSADRYAEGVRRIAGTDDKPPAGRGSAGRINRSIALCTMHGLAGGVDELAAEAQRLAEAVAAAQAGGHLVCYAEANLGRAAYERSDLGAAAAHFAEVVRRRHETNFAFAIGSLAGLALIAAAHGAHEEAAAYAQEVRTIAAEAGSLFARNEALGCTVRLALARGDVPAAVEAAEAIAPDPQVGSSSWYALELPQLTKAAALIAAGGEPGLARAEVLTAEVLALVEAQHNVRPQICALATLALLSRARGREDEAQATLARALGLAAPRGYVRALADRGPGLEPPLRALAARGAAPEHVARVLAALRPGAALEPRAPTVHPGGALPEVLTRRELEILNLLAERWSDKEIARRLVIAPNTVRKHTSTLYDKLGVSGRREAVDAARALGLLPKGEG
jgi:LuxR family maltose regulon positive regulatory protein